MIARSENWQKRVLVFADTVPEVAHAASYVNSTTGRVGMRVIGTGKYDKILTAMLDGFPLGRVDENIFLVGEVLVTYEVVKKTNAVIWQSHGKADYEVAGKTIKVRGDDGKMTELDRNTKAFVIYREDRTNRLRAWSPHKAMLDVLESMYVHQLADAAVATSRLAGAGIMYVPNDEMMDMANVDGGQPEPGSQAHFEMLMRQAFTDSIKNRSSQDAYVPLIMFGAAEYADGLKHLMTERVDDAQAFSARIKAYRERYGAGIDLPAEVVTGMGETNHWAAWKVDQNTWQYYLQPLVQLVANALVENFVTPVALGLSKTIKPEGVKIELDATQVIVKPDKTDAAIRLYSLGALSAEAALRECGFDAGDVGPNADAPKPGASGEQPDGNVRMPSANFRGNEGEPIGDRNFQR